MIQAIGEYIIFKAERIPKGGIVLTQTGEYTEKLDFLKEKLTVLSVGEEVKNIKPGDRIVVGSTGVLRSNEIGKIVDEENKENVIYFIGKEKDIAAVVKS